jgi:CMP-N,N'-diacetyllegionaminic acid synthase
LTASSERDESSTERVVGFVQARLGSQRVPYKNLRMVGGKSIVEYGVDVLKKVPGIDDVYINTESKLIADVCRPLGAKWYQRPEGLASSSAKLDDYAADFLRNVSCDILVLVNPCVVFMKIATIEQAVAMVLTQDYDTVVSGVPIRTHVLMNGIPVNFAKEHLLPRTQDLQPLHALNFGVTVWRRTTFMSAYEETGAAVLSGRIGIIEVPTPEGLDIDTESDLQIADALARSIMPTAPRYHASFAPPGN